MKHYKWVELCQFLECQTPQYKHKTPRRNAKPSYWKLSGDGSAANAGGRARKTRWRTSFWWLWCAIGSSTNFSFQKKIHKFPFPQEFILNTHIIATHGIVLARRTWRLLPFKKNKIKTCKDNRLFIKRCSSITTLLLFSSYSCRTKDRINFW